MSETIPIPIPTSAIDAAARDRIAELTRERDEARQNITGLEQQLNESCSQLARARERAELTRERDEARQNISGLEQQLNESCSQLARARERADDARDQLDEIRRELGAGPGVTALEAVKARREAQAETRAVAESAVELLNEVRAALGVGEGELTTESAKRVVRERDEATMRHAHAKAERDGARREREEAREALAKANASLETERIAGRVATEFWQARIATLESAIRNLAKVLP